MKVVNNENIFPTQALTLHRRRRDFLLFVKILLKCVAHDYKLTLQTRALVKECVKRNRMKDEHFTPLQESVEMRLQGLVGFQHWNKAKSYLLCYQRHRDLRKPLMVVKKSSKQ
jgi:hypothetical protein